MPKGFRGYEEPPDWLTFDEIERLLGIFVRLGTRRVRLTGGEPLLRRHLPNWRSACRRCPACATCRCPPMPRGWRTPWPARGGEPHQCQPRYAGPRLHAGITGRDCLPPCWTA
jgi:hypothetical protein